MMTTTLPSGSEVEAARIHIPVGEVDHVHLLPPATDSGLRHRVDNLKSRGIAAVQSMQRSLSTKMTSTTASVRSGVQSNVTKAQTSMRTNPMLWAGVASGTGLVLGLIGRFIHWRAHRPVPDLVIIDATC